MRPFKFVILLVLMGFSMAAISQSSKQKKWKRGAINIGGGVQFENMPNSRNDFLGRHDNTTLLPLNTDTFSVGCEPYCYLYDGPYIHAYFSLSLNPFDKEEKKHNRQQELRLGLNVAHYSRVIGFKKEWLAGVDTFQYKALSYRELMLDLGLEGAYLFSTNHEKRFVFYTGAGLRMGFPLVARTDESIQTGISLRDIESESDRYILSNDEVFNQHAQKFSIIFRPFIPLGARVRLSAKAQIWLEAQGGFRYRQIFGGEALPSPYFGATLGYRAEF